jgi:hypothetical protein
MVEIAFICSPAYRDRLFSCRRSRAAAAGVTGAVHLALAFCSGFATGALSRLFRRHPEGLLSLLVISLLFF